MADTADHRYILPDTMARPPVGEALASQGGSPVGKRCFASALCSTIFHSVSHGFDGFSLRMQICIHFLDDWQRICDSFT